MRCHERDLSRVAALALGLATLPASVASALDPSADGRFIHVAMATPSDTLMPAPFQPFSASLVVFQAGLPLASASQESSVLADGIVATGTAASEFPSVVPSESVLDVSFDLDVSSVFSLQGMLRAGGAPGSISFELERIAPGPAVLISRSATATLDELAGMLAGSYRLRAAATGTPGGFGTHPRFDIDFQLVCSSEDPEDGDGDGFVDACDVCPAVADPDQTDTDGDGIGDACEIEVPVLGNAARALLALALLLGPVLARRVDSR